MNPPVPIDSERIRALILRTLPEGCDGAALFGPGGALDSLALVGFLADLEYRVSEEFGREVALASEAAMSRSRSPFRDVTALTQYLAEVLAP